MSTHGQEVSQSNRLTSLDEVELVLDADSHLTESLDDLLPYFDPKFDGIKDVITQPSIKPMSEVFSSAQPTPSFPYQMSQDTDPFHGEGGPEAKKEQMEKHEIDYSILDPTLSGHLNTLNNSRYAVAFADAYNSFVLDVFGDFDDLFQCTMVVAPQKPGRAAEEIDRRAGEKNIVGVHLPPSGLVPPAGHRMYYPIYEAAQKHGLPIIYHTLSGISHRDFPVQLAWNETAAAEHAINHPFTHMWHLTTLMFEGVPELFPNLDFVFIEAGVGWIPYMKFRLDDHYLENSHEIPGLDKLPSEYIDDQCYFTTQPLGLPAENDEYTAWFIEMAGPENIMYSADIPHPDFDPPRELFDRINAYFDADTVSQIMGRTAKSVYALSI